MALVLQHTYSSQTSMSIPPTYTLVSPAYTALTLSVEPNNTVLTGIATVQLWAKDSGADMLRASLSLPIAAGGSGLGQSIDCMGNASQLAVTITVAGGGSFTGKVTVIGNFQTAFSSVAS